MKFGYAAAVLIAGGLLAAPASAHHSNAMFDNKKELVISGVVKEWQYVNPHAWLQVLVTGEDGKVVQWSFEGARPGAGGDSPNSRTTKDTFKPGDHVSVKTHPMRDGRRAGSLETVTFANGRVWSAAG